MVRNMLIRCFKGLIVVSETPPTEMKKGLGHWREENGKNKHKTDFVRHGEVYSFGFLPVFGT